MTGDQRKASYANNNRGEAFDINMTVTLQKWMLSNIDDPYPRRKGLTMLAVETGLTRR